jgi:hypothetical protein
MANEQRASIRNAPAQIQKISLQSLRCQVVARIMGMSLATIEAPKLPHIFDHAIVEATFDPPIS